MNSKETTVFRYSGPATQIIGASLTNGGSLQIGDYLISSWNDAYKIIKSDDLWMPLFEGTRVIIKQRARFGFNYTKSKVKFYRHPKDPHCCYFVRANDHASTSFNRYLTSQQFEEVKHLYNPIA